MDEERSAPAISPEPPDDGDSSPPAPQPNSHITSTIESPNGYPDPKPFSSADVAHIYTEPLILRLNGTQERLRGDHGDKCNGILSHSELTTPSKSITSQPAARPTPIHHTQPCRTQPGSQMRNGTKHHTHSPHTHCPHHTHTPHTHTLQSNGVRNGGPHPKLGSLPRGGSSTSSSSSGGPKHTKKLQSNPSITSQSSKRSKSSKSSSKSNSSQIPTEAQDDCCVHCILACLFCEFLTLCNIVLDCATCGSCAGDDSCFCCCCASEECGDCDLPCDMDCGIIDACCESADCLEICMECCSLCFSS
uniref:myoD family inhibitor domain-containing protein n=1 Tax=Semicossyphus pulcher TaxID=241346 RepID=UPI0037E8E69F